MKCIVKGCEKDIVEGSLCEEHYAPEKQVKMETTAAEAVAGKSLGRQATLLMHSALLVSGKIASRLVRGYTRLFSLTPQERAQVLDYVARADLKKGKRTKSLAAFEDAVRLDPKNPVTHFRLGEYHAELQHLAKACECFSEALALAPESAETCCALGEAYYSLEDFKSAQKHLRKAVKLAPQTEKAYYLLGLTSDKLGSLDSAVKYLQVAVDLNPRCIEYYYSLGFVYESHGKKDQALETFKKAVELERAKTS